MRKSNWIISPGIKQKYMFETTTQWVTGWTNPPSKWRYNNPTYNLLTGAHSPNKASFRKPVSGFHHLWSYSKLSYDTNHEILDSKKKGEGEPKPLGLYLLTYMRFKFFKQLQHCQEAINTNCFHGTQWARYPHHWTQDSHVAAPRPSELQRQRSHLYRSESIRIRQAGDRQADPGKIDGK